MPRPLGVLIKPTSSVCNLHCTYCFYLEKDQLYPWKSRPRLTLELFRTFLEQYAEISAPFLSFAWQGGEPTLMGLPFFEQVVQAQIEAAQSKAAAGTWYVTNALQTNGTLLDDAWADFLAHYRFLVGVSLDGPPEWHDRYRVDPAGRASHTRVMRGIDALVRHNVAFNVLTVVHKGNVFRARKLLRYLVSQGFRYLQFIPVAEPGPDGHLAAYSITPEEYGRFLLDAFDEWLKIGVERARIRFFDNLIQMLLGMPSEMCIVAPTCGQYVVLEHNGDCYPCDFFVDPTWKLGNITTTPLSKMVTSDTFRRFTERKALLAPECQSCSYKELCYGECPKYRILDAGTAEHTRSYFCQSYKMFYGGRLAEARRVAQWVHQEMEGFRRRVRDEARRRGVKGADPCPCGSGKAFAQCCARELPVRLPEAL